MDDPQLRTHLPRPFRRHVDGTLSGRREIGRDENALDGNGHAFVWLGFGSTLLTYTRSVKRAAAPAIERSSERLACWSARRASSRAPRASSSSCRSMVLALFPFRASRAL